MRGLRPEYVGLLIGAVEYLNAHSDDYEMQLGGARNFGAGIVDAQVVNPLYSERELRRVYNRAQNPTKAMGEKDDVWREECRDVFVRALQSRVSDSDGELPGALDRAGSGGASE